MKKIVSKGRMNIGEGGFSLVIQGNNNTIINGMIMKDCTKGEGKREEKQLNVKGSKDIVIDGIFEVNINITNEEEGIIINTFENIMPLIDIKKEGKILKISYKECVVNPETIISINVKELEGISSSGVVSTEIKTEKELKIDDFYVALSGTSNCKMEGKISFEDLQIYVSGTSSLEMKGKGVVNDLEIDVSGSSRVKLLDTLIESAEVDVSGTSKLFINAKYIEGDVSGISKVYYIRKNLIDVDVDIDGLSEIINI